jgi:hypothetical protein
MALVNLAVRQNRERPLGYTAVDCVGLKIFTEATGHIHLWL